jgi:hypothetical protein
VRQWNLDAPECSPASRDLDACDPQSERDVRGVTRDVRDVTRDTTEYELASSDDTRDLTEDTRVIRDEPLRSPDDGSLEIDRRAPSAPPRRRYPRRSIPVTLHARRAPRRKRGRGGPRRPFLVDTRDVRDDTRDHRHVNLG